MIALMAVVSCPVAVVRAPITVVWQMLSETSRYHTWIDGQIVSIDPPGPAAAGQMVLMRTRALGRWWGVRFDLGEVNAREHRLAIDVRLPLGIVNHEVITCQSLSPTETRVGFN